MRQAKEMRVESRQSFVIADAINDLGFMAQEGNRICSN